VLVVGGVQGLALGLRRGRRRRGRAQPADSATSAPEVPIARLTVIRPGPFESRDAADAWLKDVAESAERCDELVEEALGIVNRALHAHRLATQDPHGGGVSSDAPLARRIGFGTGDELADGRWSQAIDAPAPSTRRARAEALRPQERLAAALGGREATDACETLVLRARADLDAGRTREATLQLRVGLEALLAEVPPEAAAPDASGAARTLADEQAAAQEADLAALTERREITGRAANEALNGELSASRADEMAETLRLAERVLRRRRILAG
jgi:hypothetical protein